jgi:hypothetical protein
MRKTPIFLVLAAASLPLAAQVKLTRHDDVSIEIAVDGKPFSTLYFGPEAMKPYMHPLRTADGKIVTRGYPIVDTPGETHDHPHHKGLWFAHGEVNGLDFWSPESNTGPLKKGHIVLEKIVKVQSGKKSGMMTVVFDWKTPEQKTLLTETRTTTIYSDPKLRVMDFDIHLQAGPEKVVFGDTKEGTFAIRLATPLDEPTGKEKPGIAAPTGKMTSAEGKTGEKNVWGKRSNWVDYCGKIDGEELGIAIFDHPQNPKHPTYWHARSYGLFAANIFGEHDFYNDKSRNGSVTVQPGESLRFRYRVVIHPGDTQAANIAELYKEYAGK